MAETVSAEERLGRVVRQAWVDYCIQTKRLDRQDWVVPWEAMTPWEQGADVAIGQAVVRAVETDRAATQYQLDVLAGSVDRIVEERDYWRADSETVRMLLTVLLNGLASAAELTHHILHRQEEHPR